MTPFVRLNGVWADQMYELWVCIGHIQAVIATGQWPLYEAQLAPMGTEMVDPPGSPEPEPKIAPVQSKSTVFLQGGTQFNVTETPEEIGKLIMGAEKSDWDKLRDIGP